MKHRIATVIAFLLSFTVASAVPEQRNGIVCGCVTWNGGEPPPSVAVRIVGDGVNLIDWTDANGEYGFVVPPGRYAITAPGNWASEQFRTERVKIVAGEVEVVDFPF